MTFGNRGSSVVVGVLWATVSPIVAFGCTAAWMAASPLASGLLRPRAPGLRTPTPGTPR
jgi:hypothetical protein